jgi:hypothetical protein
VGTIWVKDFNGGLDTRRLPETTTGGVLLVARDGHISRGGEFEQRAAFVPAYELPSGTIGMTFDTAGIVVFGSGATPALPVGLTYQKLAHPDGTTALERIASADLYRGKVYVAAIFADGSIFHYYDGVRVTDWYDGRAVAQFTVTGGGSGNTVDSIQVAGVAIIGSAVSWTTSSAATAAAIAAAINSHTSSPEYTAVATGATVFIRPAVSGSGANGRSVVVTTTGITVAPAATTMAGGSEAVRAPGTFSVVGGGTGAGTPATTTFTVSRGGTTGTMATLRLDGVEILGAAVSTGSSSTAFAANVAAQINAFASSPNYTATAAGSVVTLTSGANTAAVNGKTLSATFTNSASFTPAGPMSGGADAYSATFADVKVDGVSIIGSPVAWAGTNELTAAALAAEINSHTSSPDHDATVSGATISLTATVPASVPDGAAVAFTLTGGMAVSPPSLVLPNTPTQYEPGAYVQTIGQKMYATSGSVMHFSGIRAPTKWTTDAVGAGFIDMSEESSGSEDLTALAKYQNSVAVFAERVIQIWFVDPDPALNRPVQVLNNTGTASPGSVTAFGDTDVFYLDESGLRSLQARDSSNAAATSDIGIPVDALVTEALAALTEAQRAQVFGLIEPVNGRFWLIMRDRAFVFSYFPGSKISAWSEYLMTYIADGVTVPFVVDAAVTFRRRVYLRAGDRILVYSGFDGATYDATVAEAHLPYLDANTPAEAKQFQGLDVACRGQWRVAAAMQVNDETAEDDVAIVFKTTFDQGGRIPFDHRATHVSLRFRSQGVGPHKLAACAIHYESTDEDA